MAQHPIGQIALPTKRVNQTAIDGLCHRIDRQIATREVLF